MNVEHTPAISIIVPIYKAETYIHRCLDSIINQTFKDFELILVDDGSPDKSGEICDEYAAKDKRIKVIHKKNGGVASARQCGINIAIGEYTIHADPDDWMELNMLECMYKAIKKTKADLLITDLFYNKRAAEIYGKQPIQSTDQEHIMRLILSELNRGLCNKLIKSNIYKKSNIKFLEGIDYGEDLVFWIQILQINNLKISYLPKAFYHYDLYTNSNSITKNSNKKIAENLNKLISNINRLVPIKYEKEKKQLLLDILAHVFFEGMDIIQYKNILKSCKEGINNLQYSKINKLFLNLSYYNKKLAYNLYSIKRDFHFLLKKISGTEE